MRSQIGDCACTGPPLPDMSVRKARSFTIRWDTRGCELATAATARQWRERTIERAESDAKLTRKPSTFGAIDRAAHCCRGHREGSMKKWFAALGLRRAGTPVCCPGNR